jgi:hypothetical protein
MLPSLPQQAASLFANYASRILPPMRHNLCHHHVGDMEDVIAELYDRNSSKCQLIRSFGMADFTIDLGVSL